jgi:hypothetical protein
MKLRNKILGATALLSFALAGTITAQIGKPFIHDPSTIMECDGKYYTFGTGGGGLISEDGWTWNSGAVRPGGGAAPDAIKIGVRWFCCVRFLSVHPKSQLSDKIFVYPSSFILRYKETPNILQH